MEIKPVILGDSAYPVKSWLLPPYTRLTTMPSVKKIFNDEHVRGREPVERSFGHLKGRWRILLNEIDEETSRVKVTVMACCVLHNICIMSEDDTVIDHTMEPDDATTQHEAEPSGDLIRDIIAEYISNL